MRFLPRKLSYAFILFTLEERNNKLVRTINGMEVSPKSKKKNNYHMIQQGPDTSSYSRFDILDYSLGLPQWYSG